MTTATHEEKGHHAAPKAAHAEPVRKGDPAPDPPPFDPHEGDAVTANLSDSPVMTVTGVSANGLDVACEWFDTVGAHHAHTFHKSMLTGA